MSRLASQSPHRKSSASLGGTAAGTARGVGSSRATTLPHIASPSPSPTGRRAGPTRLNASPSPSSSASPMYAVIKDDINDDPLWPRPSDITHKLPAIGLGDARSRGLVSEVLELRIGLPVCREPFMRVEENPVVQFMKANAAGNGQQPYTSTSPSRRQGSSAGPGQPFDKDMTADGEVTVRVRLPTKGELEDLPVELRTQIVASAQASLATHLLPILLVRRAKLRRRHSARNPIAESIPPMAVEQLQQRVSIMASWPRAALEEVVKRLYLKVYSPREIVVHLHEPSHEMLFLAQGSVRLCYKPAKYRRPVAAVVGGRAGAANAKAQPPPNQVVSAPCTFGELNLLTEEPWSCFIKAHQPLPCYFWCLRKADFAEILETIPSHLVMNTIHMAFQRRKETMRANYPFGADKVLAHPPFDGVSWEFAKAIADKCTPQAVPKKYVLCTEKEVCDAMYFLRHGTVSAHRHDDDGGEGGGGGGIVKITAPAVICATELVHGSLNDATIRSVTDSDLYALSKASFAALAHQFPLDVDIVLDAARAQKCEEVLDNAAYYLEVLASMPIVKDCIPSYRLRQFLPLLKAKSYRPLASVCSTSEFCDRIILVTKGVLRLGGEGGHCLKRGESVGWTCCVPHRWSLGIMSLDVTVEVLEVSQIDLMNFLQAEGTLGTAVRLSEQLMFPRAFAHHEPVPPHVPFYPISRSRKPNFNEPGFSTVHMGIMAEQARRDKERGKRLQLNAPPPYRQVGSGVWIPSQKKKM